MQKETYVLEQPIKGQLVVSPPKRYTSPVRLLALVSLSVFVAETMVMLLFTVLPPLPPLGGAFLDASLLVMLAFPALYLFLLRPLSLQMDERRRAEAALREAHDELEDRVVERTQELRIANQELQEEITERQHIEAKLRESEELYRKLIAASPDAITVADSQGHITFASAKALEAFGFDTPEQILGRPLLRGVVPVERSRAQATIHRLLSGDQTVNIDQFTIRRRDGRHFIGEVDSAGLIDSAGRTYGVVSITRDITRRVEMQAALRRAHDELELRVHERTAELSRMNDELRQSEQKLRTIVDNSVDGITLIDENGLVLEWNRGQEQITGLARDEAAGQYIWDLQLRMAPIDHRTPERHAEIETIARQVFQTGQFPNADQPQERPIVRPDGTLRIVQPLASPIKTDKGHMVVNITRDVTERKQAEEALRASEMRFRTVADFTYDWEYWLSPDANIIYMSPSCERVTGYRPDEFLNDPSLLDRIVHPDDRGLIVDHTHPTLPHGAIMPIDFRLVRRDGTVRWIGHVCRPVYDEDGQTLGHRISNRDITERKQAENALREQEKLYRSIFETATDGLVISTHDGTIVEVNGAFCGMHACERDEPIGRRITSFIHPTHRHRFAECVHAIQAGAAFEAQAVSLRKDDQPFHVEMRGIGLIYYGEPHILTVIRDVSQQVEAYMQLEQRVQERTHELRMLLEFSQSLTRTLEMQPLLSLILEQLHSVVDYSGAAILTLSGKELIYAAHKGLIAEHETRRLHFSIESPLGRAVIGQTRPTIIPDVQANTSLAIAFQKALGNLLQETFKDTRSWMGIPLVITDHTVGILAVSHRQSNFYTQRYADLASGFASHAALAIENAQLYARAKDLATIQERQRLARDLHDSVSQTLFSASLAAQVLPRLWERHPAEGQQCLDELSRLTRGALAEMRTLLVELRPNVLVETKLGDLLRQLAEAFTSRTRVPVQVIADDLAPMPADAQVALYRIAQESLNNIAKHAAASQAIVQLRRTALDNIGEFGVELTISDDGRGFSQAGIAADHLGLGIMRERAEAINAGLHIDSESGRGTRIVVTWSGPNL